MAITYSDIQNETGYTFSADGGDGYPKHSVVTAWIARCAAVIDGYDPNGELNATVEDAITVAYVLRRLANFFIMLYNRGAGSATAQDQSTYNYGKMFPDGLLTEEIDAIQENLKSDEDTEDEIYAIETY